MQPMQPGCRQRLHWFRGCPSTLPLCPRSRSRVRGLPMGSATTPSSECSPIGFPATLPGFVRDPHETMAVSDRTSSASDANRERSSMDCARHRGRFAASPDGSRSVLNRSESSVGRNYEWCRASVACPRANAAALTTPIADESACVLRHVRVCGVRAAVPSTSSDRLVVWYGASSLGC